MTSPFRISPRRGPFSNLDDIYTVYALLHQSRCLQVAIRTRTKPDIFPSWIILPAENEHEQNKT
jgi:hypothetical protein